MITTKDLGALNELMTFENWMAIKLIEYSKMISNDTLKDSFAQMAEVHVAHHQALLEYLEAKA